MKEMNDQENTQQANTEEGSMIGKIIQFGRYPQSNVNEDFSEPILWVVVEEQRDRIRLLATQGLDAVYYFQPLKAGSYGCLPSGTWRDSHIRDWLNSDFAEKAFNRYEFERILDTVTTIKDAGGCTFFGEKYTWEPTVTDKVSLLSIQDVCKYVKEAAGKWIRTCDATEYAVRRGVIADRDRGCRWWLTDNAPGDLIFAAVAKDAHIQAYAATNVVDRPAVRPSIWIRKEGIC
ncbi:MAG: DUF6273 domain-containing protein [Eubacterium sp.]|nr:DUF6273 domain-containing protein [Eubacterium sp.]